MTRATDSILRALDRSGRARGLNARQLERLTGRAASSLGADLDTLMRDGHVHAWWEGPDAEYPTRMYRLTKAGQDAVARLDELDDGELPQTSRELWRYIRADRGRTVRAACLLACLALAAALAVGAIPLGIWLAHLIEAGHG